MKRVLITGAGSYIGDSFASYLKNDSTYEVDILDMQNKAWREKDFSDYDAVFHVAGIAHADTGNVSEETKQKYYDVNTALTIKTAEKAKADGVGQFVFMSSMIVFGSGYAMVTAESKPRPDSFYGDSKLQADIGIHRLESDDFHVVSMRPPMIYGKGSRGNYPRLSSLAKKTPIFPNYENQRSMLYIENLCECVRLVIENNESGYIYPQNREYVSTANLVRKIGEQKGKKIYTTGLFNPIIKLLAGKIPTFKKMFGNQAYAKELSSYADFAYCVVDFEESIRRTEN